MHELDDDELLESYRGGDDAAFGTLFDRVQPRLGAFLRSLGLCHDEAEDVAQVAWTKALRQLDGYQGGGRFQAWLLRIAYRVHLDERKTSWSRRRVGTAERGEGGIVLEELPDGAASPRDAAEDSMRRRALQRALGELSEVQREAVLLRLEAGLTFREIAEVMGCPLGTALSRVREATERLRQILGVPA